MQVQTSTHIFFWKHDSIYSNFFYPCTININAGNKTLTFTSSEALFMYLKATMFNDDYMAQGIYNDQRPWMAKRLGKLVKGFNNEAWAEMREQAMYIACWEKFSQNPDLAAELLCTGDLELVEASPIDFIWGVGLAPDDPAVLDPANWKGLNLLGKTLMRVRADLLAYLQTEHTT
jgi:ribA/ribD-fused uncharacterized protein